MSMPAKKKRRLNLDTVVMEAAKLCDEVGLERLSLSMLADRLGIRPPSLYNHIRSLDDLYTQLSLKGMQAMTDAVEQQLTESTGEHPLLAMAEATRRFAHEHPTLFLCSTRNLRLPPEDRGQVGKRLMALTSDIFIDSRHSPEEAELMHYFIRCLIYGFLTLEANDALLPATDPDAVFDGVIRLGEKALN